MNGRRDILVVVGLILLAGVNVARGRRAALRAG